MGNDQPEQEPLETIAQRHLDEARVTEHGRSAARLSQDGVLRNSIVALREGGELSEHNSPHAASMLVLIGSVRVTSGDRHEDYDEGTLHVLTHERHSVTALADCAFLLITVTSVPENVPGSEAAAEAEAERAAH